MAEAAPGRFALGIGASSRPIVERWNGIPFAEPFKRVRDTVHFLRAALRGERVDEQYETFTVSGFRLEHAPSVPPQILVAGLRPGMLRLAAREADGAIINWLSAEDVDKVADIVGPDKEIVGKIFVCPTHDRDTFRHEARRLVATYLNVDVYAAQQEWLGRGELLKPMWDAWGSGDRKGALALIPDRVIDELFVYGEYEECRVGIQRYVKHGVTTPMISLLPFGLGVREAMTALAPGS